MKLLLAFTPLLTFARVPFLQSARSPELSERHGTVSRAGRLRGKLSKYSYRVLLCDLFLYTKSPALEQRRKTSKSIQKPSSRMTPLDFLKRFWRQMKEIDYRFIANFMLLAPVWDPRSPICLSVRVVLRSAAFSTAVQVISRKARDLVERWTHTHTHYIKLTTIDYLIATCCLWSEAKVSSCYSWFWSFKFHSSFISWFLWSVDVCPHAVSVQRMLLCCGTIAKFMGCYNLNGSCW